MQPAGGIVDHADQIQLRPALFQPWVLAGIPLHQLATARPPLAPRVDLLHFLFPRLPEPPFDHPRPYRFAADRDLVMLAQILAGQRGTEPAILFLSQNRHRLGLALLLQPAVGSFSPPPVDDRLVALPFQLYQQSADMSFGLPDLQSGLSLSDQPLLGFLQSDQPIAVPLRHEKCS